MKKPISRYVLATLILILAIAAISACGSGNKTTEPPAGTTTQPPAGGTTPTTTGDATKGEALYKGNCLACHGTEGTGGHNGPDLQTSTVSDDAQAVIAKINAGGGGMPAFKGVLTDDQINDLAAYITEVVAPKQ